MFDPDSPSQVRKLCNAVRSSHRRLQPYRKARRDLVRDYVGACYGEPEAGKEMPVNMLALMVDVYLMHLAGNNPQVILPTPRKDILPFVADLEAIVNQELRDIRFDKIVRRWVQEAIFCLGIVKCGLVDGEYVELIPGEPVPTQDYFVEVVDFDDFVYDVEASSWEHILFIGDRYRVDYDNIMRGEYPSAAKASLKVNEQDPEEEDRTSDIGMDRRDVDEAKTEFRRTACVWDICLPEERLVLTVADNTDVMKPLKVVEWDGPSTNPYHLLSFTDVPGNAMPLAPGQLMKSLNRSMNALYRKLVEQAKRQKTMALFRHGEHDDAKRIQEARDGDLIPVSHPDVVKEVMFGGAAQENLAFSIQLRDWFSQLAGNLDAMGGLGPQSETFRQDALIQATVSQKAAKMQSAVADATVQVIRDLIYRIWNDPIRTYQARRAIAGTDVEIAIEMQPGQRQGSFTDFDVQIEPYSMQYRSPRDRSQEILQLMTTIVFPAMPFLQQQGIGVNLQRLFEYLSKYLSLPELQHIFEYIGPPMPGTGADGPQQPDITHRTYERVNRPGATRAGNDRTMQQLLMGGNPQPSQTAALGRPTGV